MARQRASDIDERYGAEIDARIAEQGIRESGAILEEIVAKECGALSMTSTEDDVMKELQTRMSLNMIVEKHRSAAVEKHVREQFETDLRGLTDAEQDSKELKSAKQHLLYERIIETVKASGFPVGPVGTATRR